MSTTSKTKAHRIRNLSGTQFTEFIQSLDWEIDAPQNDYGEDFWIRVFKQGNFSGEMFLIQLKGTDNISQYVLQTSSVLSYNITQKKLKQWSRIIVPIYIVLWDISSRNGYWLDIHEYIYHKSSNNSEWLNDIGQNHKIHIPQINKISTTEYDLFLKDLNSNFQDIRSNKEIAEKFRHFITNPTIPIASTENQTQLTTSDIRLRELSLEFDKNLLHEPLDAETWIKKAYVHYDLLEMDKALFAINKAWEIDKESLNVRWGKACILCEYATENNGKPQHYLHEAILLFKSVEKITDSITVNYNIGNCWSGLGEYTKAIEHYDIALRDNPPDNLRASILKNKGTCYFNLGDHDKEIMCYMLAIEANPHLWEAYVSLGTTESHLGHYEKAVELLKYGISLAPAQIPFWKQEYALAFALWKSGNDTEALQYVNQVIAQNPLYDDAGNLKAYILMTLWRNDLSYVYQAIKFFENRLADNPEDINAISELSSLDYAKSEYKDYRNKIEFEITKGNATVDQVYQLANLLEKEGNPLKAISLLEKNIASDHIEHHYYHRLANLYEKIHDYDKAIEFYEKAMIGITNPIPIAKEIADCHWHNKDYDACIGIMLDFIALESNNPKWWTNLRAATTVANKIQIFEDLEILARETEVNQAVESIRKKYDIATKTYF